MQRTYVLFAALVVSQAAIAFAGSPAESKSATDPDDLVALALLAEARGDQQARADFLQQALAAAPDLPAAHWQSGKVWHGEAWVTPEQAAAQLEEDRRLAEYRNVRDSYADTIDGQLELAGWCQRKGLHDQARAHWTRVLDLNPGHVAARRELGHRWVEGVWLTPAEQAAGLRRAIQAEQSLTAWSPKLEKLRDALDRRNQRQREIALERLKEIKDPLAIPALEAVLGPHNETAALALVDILAGIPGADAATALARQAVFSPSDYVRGEAAKKLHARPYEEFVPTLLAAMYTPVQTKVQLYILPEGRLLYRHAFFREGIDRGELQLNDVGYQPMASLPVSFSGRDTMSPQAKIFALEFMQKRAARTEMQVAGQNAYTANLNEQIGSVLNSATDQANPAEPKVWWEWWANRNEVEYYDENPIEFRYTSTSHIVNFPWQTVRKASCLVAGTPVWTETGFVPVEQLRIGDRVLAKDPDSGELTYKPVLRTTRRDPVETLKIDAGAAGSLTCSGGHLFWVAGRGWVRARVLEPGMMLHTLDGPREVVSVTKTPPAEVFNLIVADFHSYFVADGRWLTHDNTPQSPTLAVVPGLAKTP